jgi:hypothetical protein
MGIVCADGIKAELLGHRFEHVDDCGIVVQYGDCEAFADCGRSGCFCCDRAHGTLAGKAKATSTLEQTRVRTLMDSVAGHIHLTATLTLGGT